MDLDSCKRQSDTLFQRCWEIIDASVPEFSLEPSHFSSDKSEDAALFRSTLTGCLKISPLVFAEEGEWNPSRSREDTTSSKDTARTPTWPPNAEDAVHNLSLHREELEALRNMMVETSYVTVAKSGDDYVIAIWETDGQVLNKTLENPKPWLSLMVQSNIETVARFDDTFLFTIGDDNRESGRTDGISYYYNDALPAKKCDDRFRGVACGICDISRDKRWTVRYSWASGQHIEDYHRLEMERFETRMKAVLEEHNGEAAGSVDDNGEAIKELNLKNQECLRKGLEEMGYDNPEEYF